jgi:hypothetical protein
VKKSHNSYAKRQNPLGICVGDTVRIHFEHMPEGIEREFDALVIDVTDRAGMGQDAHIDYTRVDSYATWFMKAHPDLPLGCSVSHVAQVVTRAPYMCVAKGPENIFGPYVDTDGKKHNRAFIMRDGAKKGVRYGSLSNLTIAALATYQGSLTRGLDTEKMQAVWAKHQMPGRITPTTIDPWLSWCTFVRWKSFRRWVLQHRHLFLMTLVDIEQSGRESHEAMWKDYDEDADAAGELEDSRDLDRRHSDYVVDTEGSPSW